MKMNIREEKTEWGICYYYSTEAYRFALYYYDDDPQSAYLANVDVYPKYKGKGNTILLEAEQYAKKHGAIIIYLRYLKTSWVGEWYKRHGYKYHGVDTEDDRYIWLKRII